MNNNKQYEIHDIIQFNENHKWCGCLGITEDIVRYVYNGNHTVQYLIGVPVPQKGAAYIFSQDAGEFEYIGKAVMVSTDGDGGTS